MINGKFVNLDYHQQRVDRSRRKILGKSNSLKLEKYLKAPDQFGEGIVKCRLSYGERLGPMVFSNYVRKIVHCIQLVRYHRFDYSVKYEDRSEIDRLYQMAGRCDEVLISCDGFITDTSYSNVVLYDGLRWYTPASPLLEGTQRAKLLEEGVIEKAEIHISELPNFQKLVLINAMLEFDPEYYISITDIKL